MCIECNKHYQREHYKKNSEDYKRKAAAYKRKAAASIALLKEATPCKDCGQFLHACQMDFDHTTGVKNYGIAGGGRSKSYETLLEELKLCELVCANCHRLRTFRRRRRSIG